MTNSNEKKRTLRSAAWFNNPDDIGMSALYLERYLNYGLTVEELQSHRPIIGIAQTGSDLVPCNRVHLELAQRVKEGVRDAGGIAMEFPTHPLQETGRRPTAALDRNLAYLSLVEVLHGYPLDGVVLTTGCDKTTPSCLMAAATVDIPAIVLSGGPMLDGHWRNRLVGSGSIIWEARRRISAGEINQDEFNQLVMSSAPSQGHCNTMGTALSMNCLAEALGMSLPGCGDIPAAYRERRQMAYLTGKRIVEMVNENLCPSNILTRQSFLNAIAVNSAIGGSTNCPIHLIAIARHLGVDLNIQDWETYGYDVPLLANVQPAGQYLAESFHNAGGLPAVMKILLDNGKLSGDCLTVTGRTVADNISDRTVYNEDVIRPYNNPLAEKAGFIVLSGNLFDSALMKTSVIDDDFKQRYLSKEGDKNAWEGKAIIFDGPEDYHAHINDADLGIDENSILFIRNTGPLGYPGSAEVVNMQPPDRLIKAGIKSLPCIGDGRQSGTSGSPSILNASPEAALGGGLAILRSGDTVRIDLNNRTANVLIGAEELAKRKEALKCCLSKSQTPWQEIYRATVTQLEDGACLETALKYRQVKNTMPRHSH